MNPSPAPSITTTHPSRAGTGQDRIGWGRGRGRGRGRGLATCDGMGQMVSRVIRLEVRSRTPAGTLAADEGELASRSPSPGWSGWRGRGRGNEATQVPTRVTSCLALPSCLASEIIRRQVRQEPGGFHGELPQPSQPRIDRPTDRRSNPSLNGK